MKRKDERSAKLRMILCLMGAVCLLLGRGRTAYAADASGQAVYVAGWEEEWPLSYYDRRTGETQGVLPDLLDMAGGQEQIAISYIYPERKKDYLKLAQNIQVDAIWILDPDENLLAEQGLKKGAICVDFEKDNAMHSAVLYYTRSMDERQAERLEYAFSMISQEHIGGLFLKHALLYRQNNVFYRNASVLLLAVSVVLLVFGVTSVRYIRKRHKKKLRVYTEKLPDVEMWKTSFHELTAEHHWVNYAVVRMSAGLDRVAQVHGYEEAVNMQQQLLDVLEPYIEKGREVIGSTAEFELLILLYSTDAEQLTGRINRVYQEIGRMFLEQNKAYTLELRSGVRLIEAGHSDVNEVLGDSMIALEYAKKHAEDCVFYDQTIQREIVTDYEMEYDAELAFEEPEFLIYLQPLVDLNTNEIKGAETLVRWKHKKRGMLAPDQFLGVIKKKHLLGKLNMEVYRQGCQVLHDEMRKGRTLCMLFHFTIDNAEDQDFADHLEAIAAQYGIDRKQIRIQLDEITDSGYESVLLKNIARLKEYGFYICMKGLKLEQAFLQYLQGYIDGVKFTYQVVRYLEQPGAKETFEKAVVLLRSMNLELICAGVENEAQKEIVEELGCSMAAGYYFCYPIDAETFHEIMDDENKKVN